RALASGGVEEFYRGEIARRIASFLEEQGSLLRFEDLAAHESTWVEPISTGFRGYVLHELPPNGQGIVAVEIHNSPASYPLESFGHNSAKYTQLCAEATKLAFDDRGTWVTDLDVRKIPVETLISKEYAEKMRGRIDRDRAQSFPRSTLDVGPDTVY